MVISALQSNIKSSISSPASTISLLIAESVTSFLAKLIGLPLSMSGKDTEQTKKVKTFSDKLSSKNVKIVFIDERWSSKAAKRSIIDQGIKTGHNKSLIDKTAAALFLQQYLDQKK